MTSAFAPGKASSWTIKVEEKEKDESRAAGAASLHLRGAHRPMQRLVEFFLHLGHKSISGLIRSCMPRSQASALHTDSFKCTRCVIRIAAVILKAGSVTLVPAGFFFIGVCCCPAAHASFRRFRIHRSAHHWCSFADC